MLVNELVVKRTHQHKVSKRGRAQRPLGDVMSVGKAPQVTAWKGAAFITMPERPHEPRRRIAPRPSDPKGIAFTVVKHDLKAGIAGQPRRHLGMDDRPALDGTASIAAR